MKLHSAAWLLLAHSSTTSRVMADAATGKTKDKSSTGLRHLRGSSKARAAEAAALLFPISSSDPFADFARTGLDRSLAYINTEVELNLPLSGEEYDSIAEYIQLHSSDGRDDNTEVCTAPSDHDPETVDPYGHRFLQADDGHTFADHGGHSEHHFIESSCNADLASATCVDWSAWINGTSYEGEVKVPCGECVRLDASPGEALYGAKLTFWEGLNVVGKLTLPNDAAVELYTKYVYVQGVLSMPQPAEGSSSGLPSPEEGDRVMITLYGMENMTFVADDATDNAHHGGKGVNNKAIVVAGGRLDIRAMDPTCPSWVKLQSVTYGDPLPNVALGKPATQLSTYQDRDSNEAHQAVDGNDNSFTHTNCNDPEPWWEVDLLDTYTIGSMKIVNRLDCCGGRLHDFDITFLNETKGVVKSMYNAGGIGNRKTYSTDFVNARFVKIQLRDIDCLQLGEVALYGYPAYLPFPTESLDVVTVGEDAARCWGTKGSRLMLTSDTFNWWDSHTAIVADAPSPGVGKLPLLPMPEKKTAADETHGYPDFAVEVALLDRSLVIRGEKETTEGHEMIGGHLIVLHTPMVHQHLEGALLTNMGQQARLGRYPLHFHMSECVHGSTLAKNVIWKSNQRCIVIHGTHNVTIDSNVAYDTKGHCFILEDGGEWHNKFLYNLGAKTSSNVLIRPQETDNRPSTFWITNPSNQWIGNVAAGSAGPGFWFELKLRAPSSGLGINEGVNPKILALGAFDDNTAHSNNFRAGITTYESGYRAPPGTTWNNIKAYKNKQSGLFQHGTNNINLVGGLLADNNEAARNFHHEWAIYDGVEIIGRSQHVQDLIDQGRISISDPVCGKSGGISLQPNEGMGHGTTIQNCKFSGFDRGCTGGKNAAVWVENDQVRNGVFDGSHTVAGNTFGANDTTLSACLSINSSRDNTVRYVAVEDVDGSVSRVGPGFYVQNEPAITNFLDTSACTAEENCLLFCPNMCLRLGIVSVSQALTTRGFTMHIADGARSATVGRGSVWFDEKQNHLSAQVPFVLPAPASGTYEISFTDPEGKAAWPGYAKFNLERAPACGAGVEASQIQLVMPEPDERCEDLFLYDEYEANIHGWQNFFAGIGVSQDETQSYVISTLRRKNDRGHVNLSRSLDASCFKGLPGRKYTLFGKIRITDADGNYVATDGNSDLSPKVSFNLEGVWSRNWRIATSEDGSWADWSQDITLPADTSAVWKATIVIDKAEKREFHIKDWGMILTPSEAPTSSPTSSPSVKPTTAKPSSSPTPLPTLKPTTAAPVTGSPTGTPITAAPVSDTPTNLALEGLASASDECHNGWARKVIDNSTSTISHSCSTYGAWIMVDLGKDTVNHIDKVVVRNRVDCCGGRLRKFHVEVLDADKNVEWTSYHDGWVGNGGVRTFQTGGALGRYVKLRFDDTYKENLHIAELEAWGYPIIMPADPEPIVELAHNRPAEQSSTWNKVPASRGVDGDFTNFFHTNCNAQPWWEVDLGVESFVQDVWIKNRPDCCGGRLRSALVELLDTDRAVVETRTIVGSVGNGKTLQKVFNEETSVGRYVRVSMARNDCLHFAEMEVFGYHTMGMPTSSPTPTLVNLSANKPTSALSTYNNNIGRDGPQLVVDGVDESFSHSKCWTGQNQWWEVDLGGMYTIASIEVVNRLNCCGGRLHDYTFSFKDEGMAEVATLLSPGSNGDLKTHALDDFVIARHVRITLGDKDCLQLGEVRVWGW